MRLVPVVVAVVALSSCNFPTVLPQALNTEFKPTGEVLIYDRTVGFDEVRVRSPRMNLAKRTDGSWGGTFNERAIDVSVTDSHVRGVDFTLSRELEGAKTIIIGQFQGKIYRFELDDKQALIRGPTQSMTYPGRQVTPQQTTYGQLGNLQLRGEAGSENPPWPQIGFALMAMMH